MNMMRQDLSEPPFSPIIANRPEDLEAIHQPDCAATIWQRDSLLEFQAWIEGLKPDVLPQARMILKPHQVREAVSAICDDAGLIQSAMRDILIDDISGLADVFSGIMKAPHIRLRLDVVTGNACKRFHIDALTARLICTYRGTGTQYGIAANGTQPQHISTVPTGSPIVLRGTEYPTTPKSSLLHRSPPIEGTGEARLVLVLDPVTSPDEDA